MMADSTNVIALPATRKATPRNPEKKRELALHALSSLAELGFAKTNLRDVAQRSGVSLGVIHYYFANKNELLACSIGLYKEGFVREAEELIAAAPSPEALASSLADFMAQTVAQQAHLHRLWYDMRAQAQFDPAFQPGVAEAEQALTGIFRTLLATLDALGVARRNGESGDRDPLRLYIILDGWFRHFLQRHLAGDTQAAAMLRAQTLEEFARLCR